MHARIVEIAHTVPSGVETSEALAPKIGRDSEWIRENAGVHRRHVSEQGDDPAKLVASIARPMVERCGVPDLVINAGCMPRQLLPEMSAFVARELELHGVPGFTINAACLSFLVALRNATALISDGSHNRILVCTAEFGTKGRNFDQPEAAALIGDGAAAAMVEACEEKSGILHYAMETWPEAATLAEVRGGGVMRPPTLDSTVPSDNLFDMQGENLLRFVLPRLSKFTKRFLRDCALRWKDIDLLVPHQASAAGLKILERLGVPEEKVVNILADYGNCVAASIPMALSIANEQGRIRRGDRIMLLGTASGVSIAAAVIQW